MTNRSIAHLATLIIACLAILAGPSLAFASTNGGSSILVSLANQNPAPATAGGVFNARIAVQNIGGSASNNVTVSIVPSYPFVEAPGSSLNVSIGQLSSYQTGSDSKIVKFTVGVAPAAASGTYNLTVQYHEVGQPGSVRKEVPIEVVSNDEAEISIDKNELVPGQITPVTFSIVNTGSSPLRDLQFSWSNPDGVILPVGTDDVRYISYLAPGQRTDVTYDMIASTSATPDIYALDLSLSYQDPSSSSTITIPSTAGMFVGGPTSFDVSITDVSGSQISLSIANVGSVEARSVSVSIPDQPGYSVSGAQTSIIGNLNVGDYTVASFDVRRSDFGGFRSSNASAGAAGQRSGFNARAGNATTSTAGSPGAAQSGLKVDVAYTDPRGERHTVEDTVAYPAASSGNSSSGAVFASSGASGARSFNFQRSTRRSSVWKIAWPAIVIAVVVIGGLGGYLWMRRRRLSASVRKLKR